MGNQSQFGPLPWLMGSVLFVTGVFCFLTLAVSQTSAQGTNLNANVNVNNAPPVIDVANAQIWQDPGDDGTNTSVTGFASTPGPTITHTLGGNTNMIVKVNVSDANGWQNDPVNLSARLTRTTSSGASPFSGFDQNFGSLDHSAQPVGASSACSPIANVSATERTFLCGINMKYNGIPTTPNSPRNNIVDFSNEHWRVLLRASDGIVNVEQFDAIHYEFPVQLGISMDPIINLGTILVSGSPGPISNLNVHHLGNQMMDVTTQVTASTDSGAWLCTGGGFPLISDLRTSPQGTDTNYNIMDPLNVNGSAFTHTDFDLDANSSTSTPQFKAMNFRMATSQNVGPGVCTLSSVIVTALKGFP